MEMKGLLERSIVMEEIPAKGPQADKVKENFGIRAAGNISSILLLRPIKPGKPER